jgi:hypothetical protein
MLEELYGFGFALVALCFPLLLAWGIVTWTARSARRSKLRRRRQGR